VFLGHFLFHALGTLLIVALRPSHKQYWDEKLLQLFDNFEPLVSKPNPMQGTLRFIRA